MTIKGIAYIAKRKPGQPVRWYVYAWRGGPCILTATGARPKLTPDAVAAYHAAVRARSAMPEDTVSGMAAAWRASPEWADYAADTRKQWGAKLALIEAKWGLVPLAVFNDQRSRAAILSWRDKAAATSLRGADMGVQVLRALFAYAQQRGAMQVNPAVGIGELYKGGNRAAIIWEPIERYVMEIGLSQQCADAFRLACLTGLRRSDLARVPLSACGPHAIVWRTKKSRGERVVTIPMLEPLAALVAELRTRPRQPGVDTLLVNSRGKAWTPDGLDSSFGDERDRIGLDKHLHDCRGTFVTELCEAGLTDSQIAGIAGWTLAKVADIRRIYVDQARTVVAIGESLSRRAANRIANR